jgi:hypothetical protein
MEGRPHLPDTSGPANSIGVKGSRAWEVVVAYRIWIAVSAD